MTAILCCGVDSPVKMELYPRLVQVRCEDELAPNGYHTITACLVKEDTIMQVVCGCLEMYQVKQVDADLYLLDDQVASQYPFFCVEAEYDLQVVYEAMHLPFLDFMMKYAKH